MGTDQKKVLDRGTYCWYVLRSVSICIAPTKYKAKLQREACHFGSLWIGKGIEQYQEYIRR